MDSNNSLFILPFSPDLAPHFKTINEEWIEEMFELEEKDRKVLNYPEAEIIAGGGHILFVASKELGILGAVALLNTGENEF